MSNLTKEQWLEKLNGLVQSWVTEQENGNALAIFKGIAAVLERLQYDANNHVNQTFIDLGEDQYVSEHGDERSVERLFLEDLNSYRQRVKRIINQSNLPAIKQLVDSLLIRGESTIIEHNQFSGSFFNREFYLNRNIIDYEVLYNAFTILIDYQIPEATSFYNRESFLDREFLNGSSISSDSVFSNIIRAVNQNKAFGTVYRLIERANP